MAGNLNIWRRKEAQYKNGGKFELSGRQDPGDPGSDHADWRRGAGEVPAGRARRPLCHLLHGGRQLHPALGPCLSCPRQAYVVLSYSILHKILA